MFLNQFRIFKEVTQNVHQQVHLHYQKTNSILSLLECIKRFSSTSLEETKLSAIVN